MNMFHRPTLCIKKMTGLIKQVEPTTQVDLYIRLEVTYPQQPGTKGYDGWVRIFNLELNCSYWPYVLCLQHFEELRVGVSILNRQKRFRITDQFQITSSKMLNLLKRES